MKIKGIKTDNRLILFQIIKSKMYKKEVKYHNTKLNFKKAAKIIYEYHVNDKSILFFNFPGIVQKEINLLIDKTKHYCLTNEQWYNGILTNQKSIWLKNKIDLVLVYNQNLKCYSSKIKELDFFRVPIVLINNDLYKFDSECSYKIPGNFNFFEKMPVNNLLLGILKASFQRAAIQKNFIPIRLKKKRRYRKLNLFLLFICRCKKDFWNST